MPTKQKHKEQHKNKNTNYETHSQKITPQKAQKKHKLPNTHTHKKKAQRKTHKKKHKLSNTGTKNSTSKFWPNSFSRTGLLADPLPEAKFSRSWSQPHRSPTPPHSSPHLHLSGAAASDGPRKFKFSQSTFCNKHRKKQAHASTQGCTPTRLTPERQTFDLASEVQTPASTPSVAEGWTSMGYTLGCWLRDDAVGCLAQKGCPVPGILSTGRVAEEKRRI